MRLRKRIGRVTRLMGVPLCAKCHREIQRQSGEEERLGRLGRVVAGGAFLLSSVIVLLLLPAIWALWLSLILALSVAAITAYGLYLFFNNKRASAALPEKKAILSSASMIDFSWRATTFQFNSALFAEICRELNEPLLMEL